MYKNLAQKLIFILPLITISCSSYKEAKDSAENFLRQDKIILSQLHKNFEIVGTRWFYVDIDSLGNRPPYAVYDMILRDSTHNVSAFVFVKKIRNKWIGDSILYNPSDSVRLAVSVKYDF